MDKRTLTGIILILLVTFLMPFYMRWIAGEPPLGPEVGADSLGMIATEAPLEIAPPETDLQPLVDEEVIVPPTPVANTIEQDSTEKRIFIETGKVSAEITNHGGGRLVHWELKKYQHYAGGNVDLFDGKGVVDFGINGIDIEYTNRDGVPIELSNYVMNTDAEDGTRIVLDKDNPTFELRFDLPVDGGRIVKTYRFYYDQYSADVIVTFENAARFVGSRWYSFQWQNGLPYTEQDLSYDSEYARAFVNIGGELDYIDASEDEIVNEKKTGKVEWTAVRTKYFLASIIPKSENEISVELIGEGFNIDEQLVKKYTTSLAIDFRPGQSAVHTDSFTLYLGPLDYNTLNNFDADLEELVMNRDWYERIFRPIGIYVILPAFNFLHNFIPNFGWVIIVFSVLVKLLLHPLTKKSYQSMSNMQVIQPKMTEIREKYKNEPQRLQKEMMKVYSEHGVNPLGGCLPMLLQMPLLFALFIVFRSTIELRGAPWIGWITDLSQPDVLPIGITLPYLGDAISILPFLMGATMLWQSSMTMTDPKQKAMVYIMPVFLTFIFYSLPSGLNLYYAVFNLLSMIQTRMIKKDKLPVVASNGKPAADKKPASKPKPKKPKPPSASQAANRAQRRQQSRRTGK